MSFEKPTELTDIDVSFPARVRHLMPEYDDIPEEFKRSCNRYVKFQQKWFYSGLKPEEIPSAKLGIDHRAAMRHLSCIQGSCEPAHEHKEAAVAYLASLWLELPE